MAGSSRWATWFRNTNSTLASQINKVRFLKSVWFFPALLTIVFVILVASGIHGSSIGNYYKIFSGGAKDHDLIANHPREVRTDEWIVNTPLVISQEKNNYNSVNPDVGSGEDVAIIGDVPYLDWSIIFKPHNLAFFVLPFDNAFSFRWWLMAYLLILSAYFFVYLFLPAKFSRKILVSTLLSLALFFSPFIQWWYVTGTIAPIAFSLFGLSAVLLLLRAQKTSHIALLGVFIMYIAVCFCLILYPPFQIPCGLVLAAITLGLFLEHKKQGIPLLRQKIIILIVSLLLALTIIGVFFLQHKATVDIIGSTAYPGHRVAESGTLSIRHFFANHLARLFTDDMRANTYTTFMGRLTNQSEASNFILMLPFTALILLALTIQSVRKRKNIPFVSIILLVLTLLFGAWLFVPGLDILGKITLLDKVPPIRLLIGVGLINFIAVVEVMRRLEQRNRSFSIKLSSLLAISLFIFYLAFNSYVHHIVPEFIGIKWAIVLAIPMPVILFLILRKNFTLAALSIFVFGFLSTYQVNPLYKGTTSLTNSELSQKIQKISREDNRYWVSENMISVNLITMSGAPNLSGTYLYPQNDIWRNIDRTDESIYNRYSNVLFMLDRNKDVTIPDHIRAIGEDQFWVESEPCSPALKRVNVGFIMTVSPFSHDEAPCLILTDKVSYPAASFFIYKIQ